VNKFFKFKEISRLSIKILKEEGIGYFLQKVLKRIQENEFKITKFNNVTLNTLNEEQEKILEKNMVWIMGSPRSGSTWLTQLLDNYGNLIWNEPDIGMNLDSISDRNRNVSFTTRNSYFFSDHFKNKCWLPGIKKLILTRTYFQTKKIDQKIIIKEPESYAADLIMECLPNSKLIFLLRDGRDVVDSFIDAHREGSWDPTREPLLTEEMGIEKIKFYSKLWVNLTKLVWKAYQNHNPKLRLIIKYEDLLTEPLPHLKKIYDFLEISTTKTDLVKMVEKYNFKNIPSDRKGPGKFTRSATPGDWKKNLSKQEQNIMMPIMLETLKERGYKV